MREARIREGGRRLGRRRETMRRGGTGAEERKKNKRENLNKT
jgi:hypothetical protein